MFYSFAKIIYSVNVFFKHNVLVLNGGRSGIFFSYERRP